MIKTLRHTYIRYQNTFNRAFRISVQQAMTANNVATNEVPTSTDTVMVHQK